MKNKKLAMALLTLSTAAFAAPGPKVSCTNGTYELAADLSDADLVTDDMGYISEVKGTVQAAWRRVGEASFHQISSNDYATIINGPTLNLLIEDKANKQHLGLRLEAGLSSGKAIVSPNYVDAFQSYHWPLKCNVTR